MIPQQFFYHLVVLGLLWLCVMLHDAWPSRCVAAPHQPAKPIMPRRKRSSDPQPFPGLTRTPPCAACAPAHASAPQLPGCPPPRIVPTRGRPRQVDTSQHCCPHPDCAYRGWVGLGNISANGLPTICQPQFVNRYIREKIHLLKRKQASGKVDHRTGFLLQAIRQNYANPEFAHELQREAFEAGRQAKQAREKQVKMLEQHKAAIESTREKAMQAMYEQVALEAPEVLEAALAPIFAENGFYRRRYEHDKSALENYQASLTLRVAFNPYLERHDPQRFESVRRHYAAQINAVEEQIATMGC